MSALSRRQLRSHFAARDPVMAALIEAAGPYRLRTLEFPSPFRHLCKAIIAQQISGSAAASIQGRFVALFDVDHGVNEFPAAEDVLSVDASTLRSAGLSAAKAAAIVDLATKTVEGRIPTSRVLKTLDDEEIIERLTSVRGIGRWTVQMMLMFQLGRQNVLPETDLGVQNGFRIAYRRKAPPTPGELRHYAECWAPYRSAAAWYLWRAVDLQRAGVDWPRPRLRMRLRRRATRAP